MRSRPPDRFLEGRIRLRGRAEEITTEPTNEIPQLLRDLYRIVERLETLFPGRRFTLDGHLVGSIGEVLAAHYYGLELLPPSAETHDAQAADGRLVQIKATQRTSVGLGSSPDHLLVLQILPGGAWREIYNGPGGLAWENAGKMQKNGHRPISASRLTRLMENVPAQDRLEQRA